MSIQPTPPTTSGVLPRIGAGFRLLQNPLGFLEGCRGRHGDTFAVQAFGYEILFLFSPAGVRNLWAAPEAELSKGLADYALLRHKVPDELFAGRRTYPHDLFSGDDVRQYLSHVERAIEAELDALGREGTSELFALSRRLSHRAGLASWGGLEQTAPELGPLVAALDRLDSSDSFVYPHRAAWSMLTGKRREYAALHEIDAIYRHLLENPRQTDADDLFARICEAWVDTSSPEREIGIARDVVLVHLGSMSNLFAATAWTIVHLLQQPDLLDRVRSGDTDALERCAHETIRLRQRSIVLRRALGPTSIADENTTYQLQAGTFAATMMPMTNTSALASLDRFDINHFDGRRFTAAATLQTKELVTTFGHGRHSCPAMRFSIETMTRFVGTLVERYELEARFTDPQPLTRQIGGIARADRPCVVAYRRRHR